MTVVDKQKLNIEKIARSGQCFRIRRSPENSPFWLIQAGNRALKAEERENEILFDCGEAEFDGFWHEYFDLGTDYSEIEAAVDPADTFLKAAAEYGRGIRILRQDPWEMLITFIISQRKNIPAIAACVEKLSSKFGEPLGDGLFAFPCAKALADAGEEGLGDCSLGYRLPYVLSAAEKVSSGAADLVSWAALSDPELEEKLMTFPGVGPKVASCVMLFGYHRINAFPVDVWIRRVIDGVYGGSFDPCRYEGFKGIIQQYMFFYGRNIL